MAKRLLCFAAFFVTALSAVAAASDKDEFVGPPQTIAFEKALYDRLPVYAQSIWPRREIREKGIPGEKLPREYTNQIQNWLEKVLLDKWKPRKNGKTGDNSVERRWSIENWFGIPNFRRNDSTIFGSWQKQKRVVKFQATWRDMNIIVQSPGLVSARLEEFDQEILMEVVSGILSLPNPAATDFRVSMQYELIHEIPVIYGKIKIPEFDDKVMSNQREWWWHIPFVIYKDKVFVSLSTIDWSSPPASNNDRWDFEERR